MNDFHIIKGAVSEQTCKVIAKSFRITRDGVLFPHHEQKVRGDDIVENSFSWYAPLCFEALADQVVKGIVETTMGVELYNAYSYGRSSYHGAVLPRHRDRAASDYAVSCLIDTDCTWPLYFKIDGEEVEVRQEIGDMVIYNGNTIEHWREPFEGTEQLSAFMFYVKDKMREFEGRPLQGMPYNPQWDPNTIEQTLENLRAAHGVTNP
jgi:hypothetical protein|tara:strand:+ start:608 stop:1228 length:621 start_codon:yes stop_codon:yes gene_type:complete